MRLIAGLAPTLRRASLDVTTLIDIKPPKMALMDDFAMNLPCIAESSECYSGRRVLARSPRASLFAFSCTAKKLDIGHLAGSEMAGNETDGTMYSRNLPCRQQSDVWPCNGGGLRDKDVEGRD